MSPEKNIFSRIRPQFEDGGRFSRLYPFYEAIETIFFGLDHVTRQGPHVRDSLDVKRFMTIVIAVLIPHLMFGIYNTGYQARLAAGFSIDFISVITLGLSVVMPMVIVTYAVGFFGRLYLLLSASIISVKGFLSRVCCFPLPCHPLLLYGRWPLEYPSG